MALTILSVAFPLAPVGPDAVGGAEQVLSHLDRALVSAGHHSIVVACSGSQPAGTWVETPAVEGPLTDAARRWVQQRHHEQIIAALERWPVDVIHLHGVDFYQYLPPPGVPALVTLHLPPDWYPPDVFCLPRPDTYLHCVSGSQRRACPPGAALLPDLPNGVSLDQLRPGLRKRAFAVTLGRICPEKNFHVALRAGKRAGVPVLLAGDVFPYPEHQQYFREQILPSLDRERRYVGPAGLARKRRLLAAAHCLLVPSLAPETSSLVAMEALACGTPVIAFPSGALPEIVEHGRTGFLVQDESEMAEALGAVGTLDPAVCRQEAERRFSAEHMVDRYFAVYAQLARSAVKETAYAA